MLGQKEKNFSTQKIKGDKIMSYGYGSGFGNNPSQKRNICSIVILKKNTMAAVDVACVKIIKIKKRKNVRFTNKKM